MLRVIENVDWVPDGYYVVIYTGQQLSYAENYDAMVPVCRIALVLEVLYRQRKVGPFPTVEEEKRDFHYAVNITKKVTYKGWFKKFEAIEPIQYQDQLTDEAVREAVAKLRRKYTKETSLVNHNHS